MLRLNKKLWSFNVGCIVSGAFIWLVGLSKELPIPQFILANKEISIELYTALMIAFSALFLSLILLFIMHHFLKVHSSEHTFWLVLPILAFLILTALVANSLVITMMYAAIPTLFVILLKARNKQERKIFAI